MASQGPKTGTAQSKAKPRAKAPAKPTTAAEVKSVSTETNAPVAAKAPTAEKPPVASKAPAKTPSVKAPAAKAATPKADKPVAPAPKAAEASAPVTKPALTPAKEVKPTESKTAKPVAKSAPAPKKEYPAMTTIEAMTEKTQSMFAEMNERAKAAMEKNAKYVEDMNEFAKGNVEAVVESSRITAKGMEALGQEAAEFGRKTFEDATAAMKAMSSVKSPTEFMKLQSDFARQAFDAYVAEASKSTEALLKLAGDASQPISNRVAVATEKMKVAA